MTFNGWVQQSHSPSPRVAPRRGRWRQPQTSTPGGSSIVIDTRPAQAHNRGPAVSDVAQGTFPTWATFYKWRSLSLIRRTPVAITQARERLCVLLLGRARGGHCRERPGWRRPHPPFGRLESRVFSLARTWDAGLSGVTSAARGEPRTNWSAAPPSRIANCSGQSAALSTGQYTPFSSPLTPARPGRATAAAGGKAARESNSGP